MKYFLTIALCILTLLGCRKDEELISGDIEGTVKLIASDYSYLPPPADAQVELFNNSEKINTTVTNDKGNFNFDDLPYGRYNIRCSLTGYIRSYTETPVYHVGGYSPTFMEFQLYKVPEYQISIDSVSYDTLEYALKIHLKVDGDTIAPGGNSYFHQFRAFMSNSPDVSSENHAVAAKGILADWPPVNNIIGQVAVYGKIVVYEIPYAGFENIKSEPIYMVLYPIANNQGYLPEQYLPGSLGPPSNEVVFNWSEISGE